MQWYYADDGKSVGPCSEDDVRSLAASGKIKPQTMVWHEGMANWEPYSKVVPQQAAAAQPPAAPGTGSCAECGNSFPVEEMVPYEGRYVCQACKPAFFQRIQEGASAQGTTPNAEIMSLAREALAGNWGVAVGVVAVYFALMIVSAVLILACGIGLLVLLLISGPLSLGLSLFFLALARRQESGVSILFNGFKNFGNSLGAFILVTLLVLAWQLPSIACNLAAFACEVMHKPSLNIMFSLLALPFAIPAYIAQLAYSMTFFVMADNAEIGPMDAIRRSTKMMRGRKWKVFCLYLRFIGWFLLCIPTLFIGMFWLAPYVTTSMALFYDDVKDRADA